LLFFSLLVSGSAAGGFVIFLGIGSSAAAVTPSDDLPMAPQDLIRAYCSGCHVSGRSGVDFDDAALDLEVMRNDREIWIKAVEHLRSRKMPPPRSAQPIDADRETLIRWLEAEILPVDPKRGAQILAVQRLQRSEYVNAVRELLGVHLSAAIALPSDDAGWRRREKAPELSPEDADKYAGAAQSALNEAFAVAGPRADSPVLDVAGVVRSLSCNDCSETRQDAVREQLATFARRAFRRPIEAAELEQLLTVFERIETATGSVEKALAAALAEVLTSPNFLYRIESRRADGGRTSEDNPNPFELASRLSFFLWNAPPDDELLGEAERGTLRKNLEAQTRRMLKAPQAHAFPVRFANFWLQLDKLDDATMVAPGLRKAMRDETERFIAGIIEEDRPATEILDANYTFVNEALARHYGIAGVHGDRLQRVSLRGTRRAGLLTHASILTIASPGVSGTSPVLRGKWVLENLLGQSVPRPPAGILDALEKREPDATGPGSIRLQTERHRASPSCSQCHIKMDAIGLSLENFDVSGAWRDMDGAYPVEAMGVLSDTETLQGPADTTAYLRRHSKHLVRAIGGKMLGFALGRKLDQRDRAHLPTIAHNVARDDYRFSRIVVEVVTSPSFLRGNIEPGADGN